MLIERVQDLVHLYREHLGSEAVALSWQGTPLSSTDARSEAVEAWQFVCGEGPSIDALRDDRCIAVDQATTCLGSWPILGAAIGDLPFVGVLATPLRVAGRAMGVLTVYGSTSMPRWPRDRTVAFACADHAGSWLSTQLADPSSSFGLDRFDLINRAAGVVMADVGVDSVDATALIRAFAFRSDDGLSTVIGDIIARRALPR